MSIKALTFDVFGTVVDWRSSIIREGEAFGRAQGVSADWPGFADASWCATSSSWPTGSAADMADVAA